jgi:hypothetical protein
LGPSLAHGRAVLRLYSLRPRSTVWEHSIPALDQLRYSITLPTIVAKAPSDEKPT